MVRIIGEVRTGVNIYYNVEKGSVPHVEEEWTGFEK